MLYMALLEYRCVMNRYKIQLLIISYGILYATAYGPNATRQEILEELFKNYDPSISPDFNDEKATDVTVQMFVLDVHSVSEAAMEFQADLVLRQKWVDKRLNFTGPQGRLELGSTYASRVWEPDTFFYNEKRGSIHKVTTQNKLIHIRQDGTVLYSIRVALALRCSMKLQLYPFDEQHCPFTLFSYGYTTSNVVYYWHSKAIEFERTELSKFSILADEIQLTKGVSEYDESGQYSRIEAIFPLKRKVGFHLLQTFFPSILVVVLTWISFWIDPTAIPARVSLGVVTVLTMTTLSSGARQSLPPVSYVKAIDVWMFTNLFFVFGALLEFAYVNAFSRRLKKREAEKKKNDEQKENVVAMQEIELEDGQGGEAKKADDDDKVNSLKKHVVPIFYPTFRKKDHFSGVRKSKLVDIWARRLFPFLYIIFVIIFFAYVAIAAGR